MDQNEQRAKIIIEDIITEQRPVIIHNRDSKGFEIISSEFLAGAEAGMKVFIKKIEKNNDCYQITIDQSKFPEINIPLEQGGWYIGANTGTGTAREANQYKDFPVFFIENYMDVLEFFGLVDYNTDNIKVKLVNDWISKNTNKSFDEYVIECAAKYRNII